MFDKGELGMGSNGWIKLHRCLLDKAIWTSSTPEHKTILITILCLANHQDNQWYWKGEKFICRPGQFITSSTSLAAKSGTSRQNVRSALVKFEKCEFLTYESTKTGLLINVVNWGKYQDDNTTANQASNQEVTNSQPRGNQEVTTNKNDKKVKNDKKDILLGDYVKMSNDEYQKLCDQFSKPGADKRIEKLNLYKGSTGKKYKSDYLTILSWERREQDSQRGDKFINGHPF